MPMLVVAAVLEAAMATPSRTPSERRSSVGGRSGADRPGAREDIRAPHEEGEGREEEPCGVAKDGTTAAHLASMPLT
jgi:hypothetical protein